MTSEARPQTAIQGVALATSVNIFSRIASFLRQVLITAYFGLSFQLDAFFVATSILAIFINTFGDVFDSAGIPSLVKTREQEGQGPFRDLTGSIFSLALLMGGGLTLLMVVFFPLAPLIVPGFPRESTGYIRENLLLLLPYALVFLPYHAIGSFFRSIRAFHAYYLVELLVNLTALAAVFAFGYSIRVIPLSLSLGYLAGLAVFIVWGRGRFRFHGKLRGGEIDTVRNAIRKMLPAYVILYGLIVVDRYFASYLEEGAISALFYGYILATAVPLIMNVENIVVTPLSEESDRSILLTRIVSCTWMVALPVMAFTLFFSGELVRGFFERGAFSSRSSGMTAEALRYYILGLPAFFLLPVTTRILQIFKRLQWIPILAFGLLTLNVFLNYLFVFRLGMGVKGIALATSIGLLAICATEIFLVSRIGVRTRYKEMAGVFPGIFSGIALGLGLAFLLPTPEHPLLGILVKGALFVIGYSGVMLLFPGAEIGLVRSMILDSFPALKQRFGRLP